MNFFSLIMRHGFFIFFVGVVCVKADPCQEYSQFPNEERRDSGYELGDSETPVSDQYIKEGWYGSAMDIATAAPGDYMCGTFFPIWAKEEISNDDGTLNVQMCTVTTGGTCDNPFVVNAIDCNGYKVYFLKQTPADSAYCLGAQKGDKPEQTSKPGVVTDLIKVEKMSELTFYCDFNKAEEDVFYKIYWYVDNQHVQTSTSQKWPVDRIKNRLDETTLKDKGWKTVGFNVYCSLRASYQEGSAASLPVFSDQKFIGIKVHNTLVHLDKDPVDISFELTAPFGCLRDNCALDVRVKEELPKEKQNSNCGPRLLRFSDCGVKVKQDDWNKVHTITVKPRTIIDTYDIAQYTMNLKLALFEPNYHHSLWTGDYATGNIVVETTEDKSLIKGKRCSAVSDPHMVTLDGRHYEHQYGGIFTLFTNVGLQVEVQVETSSCNGNRAYCVCGIVIRAGRSAFTIQKCPGRRKILWFTLCDEDDVLDVRKKSTTEYKILVPSGTIIEINLQRIYGSDFMNVFIRPSVHDVYKSRGLCGKLSETSADDFVLRDGTQSNAKAFSQSWRVKDENNLFDEKTFDKLMVWDRIKRYCDCKGCDKTPCGEVECGPKEQSRVCQNNWPETVVKPNNNGRCKTNARKRRSIVEPKPSYQMIKAASINKRDADDWINGWTNKSATEFCQTQFSQSPSIKLCRDIPTVNIGKNIEDCVFDIWASGGTEFLAAAIDNAQNGCIQEVLMNSTFHNTTGEVSIMEKVLKVTCPSECNGKGDCVDGLCRCQSPFSGPDCSVDLNSSPVITEVEDGGFCDVNEDSCTVISLFGDTFVDSPRATCKFRDVSEPKESTHDSGTSVDVSTVNTAQIESMIETVCTIPVPRRKRSAIGANALDPPRAYRVSVSNNGVAYSQDSIVVIYNSTCETCMIHGLTVNCTVDDNYCTVGEYCIPKGGRFPLGGCMVCDIQGDKRTWQQDMSDLTCGCMKASSMWTLKVMLFVFVLLEFF